MVVDSATKVFPSKPSSPSHRAWMSNGILYNEYVNEVSVDSVLENEEKSMDMIRDQKIQTLPMIVIFKNINKSTFKIGVSSYSRVITAFDLSRHVSGAWMVGFAPDVRKLVDVINKIFFAGKMHFVETVEQAEKEALVVLTSPNPTTLLEH